MTIFRFIERSVLPKSSISSTIRCFSSVTEKESAAVQPKRKTLLFHKVSTANSKHTVADILNKWVNEGKKVMRFDIKNLSNYFRTHKNFSAALQLYEWMESSNLKSTNADQAIRIDVLYRVSGVASAEKYFNSLQESEKDHKTYGALLRCYCRERACEKVMEILEEMKALNHASTLNYNNVLSLYYNMKQPERVVSLAQEMEEKNIVPDFYTYNMLISSHAAVKNLDAIEGVLEKMKSNKVECDMFTCGNLANIYFNSGLHETAIAFLSKMEKAEHRRNEDAVDAWRTCIKLYSEMNDLSGVHRAWEALKSASRALNNTSYRFMLESLSKLGDQENLEKLFKEWEEGCTNYDFRLATVVLNYYIGRNMLKEATSLYERLVNRGTEPNTRAWELFATICIKNGQVDLALKHLNTVLHSRRKGFPSDEIIQLFLDYCDENNEADRAESFIRSLMTVGRLHSDSSLFKTRAPNAERNICVSSQEGS